MSQLNPSSRQREAALRRALIGVKPDYYSWPADLQEQYRLNLPDEDAWRIDRSLLQSLFGIRADSEAAVDDAIETLDDAQGLLLTSTTLLLRGIGDDKFFLNEHLGDKTLLDFPTLYDYDHDDHLFQEQAWKDEDPDYIKKPYRGRLFHSWARLEIDGVFHYAFLSMATAHLYSIIDEVGTARIKELIPYEYIQGKDDGKREGAGTILDQRLAASGLEEHVMELRERFCKYLIARYDFLGEEFDQQARKAVYMIDKSRPLDPHMNFIFTDKTALQAVRFRHFMADCRALAADSAELDPLIEREKTAALSFIDAAHRDIIENFDPKVARLRQRRKIIVADGALDGLFE